MANFNLADYETVDSRIKRFYTDNPHGRITTELIAHEGEVGKTRWIVKASVWRDRYIDSDVHNELADGTGYAFEVDGSGMANKTAALENSETSAIGRALANIGYSGDKRASREEMTKASAAQPAPVSVAPPGDWRELVTAADSLKALQNLYDTEAHKWWTEDVKAAFSARKKELGG